MSERPDRPQRPRVVELFAGVGGFRLGLEPHGFRTVWANQWEPSTRTQHAFDCYVRHFGASPSHVCDDIEHALDDVDAGRAELPDHDLLVGGFPCQDYSVAKTLNQARGLQGKKGVLWWQIHRLLEMRRPPCLFLENVDRLLKSPAPQRGRDFAIMLATLNDLGYDVEWRVVNAADYGFPQKRRRVYIVGRFADDSPRDPNQVLYQGVLARALPVAAGAPIDEQAPLRIDGDPAELSESFGARSGRTPFRSAGYCSYRRVWTADLVPAYSGERTTLGDVLEDDGAVPDAYRIPDRQVAAWRYLKGAKREPREHTGSGTPYLYVEGAIPFPDGTDGPARTILTAEGGATPSRFKHVVATPAGGFRRLTPRELERLNGFPDDWTATGMPEGRRAFAMGNALVVGIVDRIGAELARELRGEPLTDTNRRGTT
jgi:DNA (cytosine-5)-methyltransferase 1